MAVQEMKDDAAALGANAVVGVDLDYEVVGQSGGMLMVTASGTAVVIESSPPNVAFRHNSDLVANSE